MSFTPRRTSCMAKLGRPSPTTSSSVGQCPRACFPAGTAHATRTCLAVTILSACGHDVGHPGINNNYMIKQAHPLASKSVPPPLLPTPFQAPAPPAPSPVCRRVRVSAPAPAPPAVAPPRAARASVSPITSRHVPKRRRHVAGSGGRGCARFARPLNGNPAALGARAAPRCHRRPLRGPGHRGVPAAGCPCGAESRARIAASGAPREIWKRGCKYWSGMASCRSGAGSGSLA